MTGWAGSGAYVHASGRFVLVLKNIPGITLQAPGATNQGSGFDFPDEEPAPRGFFEEDPTFTYPMYWWF